MPKRLNQHGAADSVSAALTETLGVESDAKAQQLSSTVAAPPSVTERDRSKRILRGSGVCPVATPPPSPGGCHVSSEGKSGALPCGVAVCVLGGDLAAQDLGCEGAVDLALDDVAGDTMERGQPEASARPDPVSNQRVVKAAVDVRRVAVGGDGAVFRVASDERRTCRSGRRATTRPWPLTSPVHTLGVEPLGASSPKATSTECAVSQP